MAVFVFGTAGYGLVAGGMSLPAILTLCGTILFLRLRYGGLLMVHVGLAFYTIVVFSLVTRVLSRWLFLLFGWIAIVIATAQIGTHVWLLVYAHRPEIRFRLGMIDMDELRAEMSPDDYEKMIGRLRLRWEYEHAPRKLDR